MARNFRELLEAKWHEGKALCVGLDPDLDRVPAYARKDIVRETLAGFNKAIIDATKDIVCAYKPNTAFYEAHGDEGMAALRQTIFYIREAAPDVPVILDAKRGDVGHSSAAYAHSAFNYYSADAVTVQPYLGGEALAPFFEHSDKGVFVLCRTSNGDANEVQGMHVDGSPLFIRIAELATSMWNSHANCGLVVGATHPDDIRAVRAVAPDATLLIPGVGAQGGALEEAVKAAKDARGAGFIISASRSILYASGDADFADAARRVATELHSAIRAVR